MKRKAFFIILILLAGFFLFLWFGVPINTSKSIGTILSPIWSTTNSIRNTSSQIKGFFVRNEKFVDENRELNERIKNLESIIFIENEHLSENKQLKAIVGRQVEGKKMLLATILVRPAQTPYDVLIIDVGEKNEVLIDQKVFIDGNIILGEIIEVGKRISKVRLYSSWGTEIPIIIGERDIAAIARGRGGANFILELPRDATVEVGDSVLVPGINLSILGVVGVIEKDPEQAKQKIYFRSPINVNSRRWVEIEV